MPNEERGVELIDAGDGRFLGIIEPVELVEEDEGPDLLISGASCIIISRFSLLVADAPNEGIEACCFVEVEGCEEVEGVEVEALDADETVLNSAGRCRACTSVIRRACLA